MKIPTLIALTGTGLDGLSTFLTTMIANIEAYPFGWIMLTTSLYLFFYAWLNRDKG